MVQDTNQHLRVYVSPATTATEPTVAADGTVLDLTSVVVGTGLPLGGITYRTNLGLTTVRDDNTISTTKDMQIFYKDMAGTVHSTIIKVDDVVSRDLARAAVSPVQQVAVLTIGTATDGEEYVLRVEVPNYGGMTAAKESAFFYGTYTAETGSTVTTIADGLVASINLAFAKCPVPIALASNVAGAISVTAIAQPYVPNKFSGRNMQLLVSLARPAALQAGVDASGQTLAVEGNGNYHQVSAEEYFYAGYNEAYKNREANWPNIVSPTLAAASGEQYTSDTIVFETKHGANNQGTQRQTVKLYFQE